MDAQKPSSPSIKQMRARMTSGHSRWLEAMSDGHAIKTQSASEARGLMTCRATLIGWGAIDENGITDIGRALLYAIAGTRQSTI